MALVLSYLFLLCLLLQKSSHFHFFGHSIYHSASLGKHFFPFKWDTLLLETGFIAILWAPKELRPTIWTSSPPSTWVHFLLKLLLFKLMFNSGVVKLLSGDPTWKDLTALTYHYLTQPIPTVAGYYAHQLPVFLQKVSTLMMFIIELLCPFFIFATRRLRQFSFLMFFLFMLLISITGNYAFFNLLTITLALSLLDDKALKRIFRKLKAPETYSPVESRKIENKSIIIVLRNIVVASLVFFTVTIMASSHIGHTWYPSFVKEAIAFILPFRTVNNYGLFAVMTTERKEIVIEGSNDGKVWREYHFKWKPGKISEAPKRVAPHQPRLDWQMWFAALGTTKQNQWFIQFIRKIFENSAEVLALLEENPFPEAPPRLIRAKLYRYEFTTLKEREATEAWWKREYIGYYLPPVHIQR